MFGVINRVRASSASDVVSGGGVCGCCRHFCVDRRLSIYRIDQRIRRLAPDTHCSTHIVPQLLYIYEIKIYEKLKQDKVSV